MKTNKIVLCPGKIPIRSKDQPWYAPIGDYPTNFVLCENCYKIFGGMMDPICFQKVYNEKYICSCTLRTFDKSSITINNIRVSIMNPDNFFRYRISKFRDEITFHIPKNEKYVIIVENLDSLSNDSKISVDLVEYDNTESRYYDKKYPQYLILDGSEDYLAYNSSCAEHHVKFNIKKWIKIDEPDTKKYYKLFSEDSVFEFKLNFSNGEAKLMNNILEINS